MSIRLYADESRCAIYEEAPGGGDPLDPNSLMNRPVLNPVAWLTNVYFHSNFDYYGAPAAGSATISHAAVAGITRQIAFHTTFSGQTLRTTHPILTHSLGYVPRFFIAYGNLMIPHGTPVQDEGPGLKRFVTGYATTTEIRLHELAYSGATNLSAASRTYRAVAFANSQANPFLDQLLIQPGNVIFGRGRFNLSWPHLHIVAPGESPFAQSLGRTAAVGNGSIRVHPSNSGPIDFGAYVNYSSLVQPSFVNVAVGR